MTAAAFKGTYADWKLIKTRGVVQVVIEVPLESAGQAYDVLGGMPNAAKEIWCAVALLAQEPKGGDPTDSARQQQGSLDTSPRQQPDKPAGGARKWGELPYSQQAALACNDAVFRAFLREGCQYQGVIDTETAAIAVRLHCGVDSRSELNADPEAQENWQKMYARYGEWKLADRVSA